MRILALDTTSEFGSLALRSEGATSAELALHSPDGFAHVIFPAVDGLLAGVGVDLADIDCFAAAGGPGSFTGVRVGLAAVKGLAEAMGKRAAGVSNLRALASLGCAPLRAVLLDARRGQIYAAVYNAELEAVAPEAVMELTAWLDSLNGREYEFVAEAKLRAMLAGTRFEGMPFVEAPRQLAAAVAACVELAGGVDPAALDANYVRRSDAELFWKDG
ncbi:MAG TPA: tRNA (adenosine(37)-N6)-threonylcarbamoyltransferase complex dimerization subunit type 1 TsaB [Bryobacteraceae bacterium]|nr:tRNA (adenosine(37)-N6)-threonylcarbamoyltransferase complex dimerization subunit type 1 TsaB [Bryobacteraceae bacterium]